MFSTASSETIFQGKPAAPGYALGAPVFFLSDKKTATVSNEPFVSAESEIEAYRLAVAKLSEHFENRRNVSTAAGDELTAQLLDAYGEMASDEELEKDISECIRTGQKTASEATCFVFEEIIEEMASIEDEYARQRADDLRSIQVRLLRVLSGLPVEKTIDFPEGGGILFGDELTPADTSQIPKERLLGIVSRSGGTTSHVAILARNLEIPAVVGADFEADGTAKSVYVDGFTGRIVFNPGEEIRREFEVKSNALRQERLKLEELRDCPAITKDGGRIRLLANIGHDNEVDLALKFGAEGVGLFRTEFLFMNADRPPSEELQFQAYRKVLEAMDDRPVTIRTFDIGGDKPLSYVDLPQESNPFLGLRGCRIYRTHSELILTQLCALYRASVFGRLRIMFPMIAHSFEVEEFLSQTREARSQLTARKIPFDDSTEIGIMIETPAAALIADELLGQVDFASLGTNDLTQYTLAVDRGNEHVASLYDARHPAVQRLIRHVVQVGRSQNKSVGLCGELSSDETMPSFFLDIGIESLSMPPSLIPSIKKRIREL